MASPRGVLMIKAEGTPGTYNDPTSSGVALQIRDLKWALGGEPSIDRFDITAAQPGIAPPLIGAIYQEITGTIDLWHWGATNSATDHPAAILFGGAPMTITAGSSDGDDLTVVTALNNETSTAAFSAILARQNGNEYKARGCVCALESITLDGVGRVIACGVRIAGLWQALPTATAINFANVTYGAHIPVQGKGATVDVGPSGHAGLSTFEFTTGQAITQRGSVEETHGYRIARVDHAAYPVLKYNVEAVVEGTFGIWGEWLGGAGSAISLRFDAGTASGSARVTLEIPEAFTSAIEQEEADGDDRYAVEVKARWSQSSGYSWRLVFGEVP